MKIVAGFAAAAWSLQFQLIEAAAGLSFLQLHRSNRSNNAPAFSASGGATLNLANAGGGPFCQRIGCKKDCKPVCAKPPCCCWSTYAADTHALYPSPDETQSKQQCLFPPEGFVYAPDPGLTYNDGYLDELKRQGMTEFAGRRLCCLRRADGAQTDSQQDLSFAVPTTTTTTVITTTIEEDAPPPAFTTETITTSLLNPGDEYENAQVEKAAREQLAAAKALKSGMSTLNESATELQEVNDELQNDPNLIRSRKHVAEMRSAIHNWAVRRWANLNKLASGDASAFSDGPAAPEGIAKP